jgi:predicted Ser/Thr protein kinase/tetratricopeptide (TPR) repeat protein
MAATIGRYEVVRPLGQGGMGAVFLGWDPSLERKVALKLLRSDLAHSALRDEARALAALRHPGIVTIFEIGEHEGREFIAMEYLPGRALRQVIQQGTPRADVLAICRDVAAAVAAAHAAGLLHRDIKPENIIVGEAGDVKVVDFGLARRMEAGRPGLPRAVTAEEVAEEVIASLSRTLSGWGSISDTIPSPPPYLDGLSPATQTLFGTPAYMAPEVLRGEGSTARSDVYSLGIVLYECLAGRRPHTGTSLVEVIAQTVDGELPALDDPLGPLVARMLSRDPAARPALAEVGAALAREIAPPARRGHGRAWAIGAALAAAAVAAGGGAWWRWHRAAAPVSASVDIEVVHIAIPDYGAEQAEPGSYADVLAQLVTACRGAHLSAIALNPSEATGVEADFSARGEIREIGASLVADFQVTARRGGAPVHVHLERAAPAIAPFLDDLAERIARAVAPVATLDRAPDRVRADDLFRTGDRILKTNAFTSARPYLAQAVDAAPDLFVAWYDLALDLAWMEAPQRTIDAATARAIATAPDGPKKHLMQALALFYDGDIDAARRALEALDAHEGSDAPGSTELEYFLGEANWHDGRFDAAFAHFRQALSAEKAFHPAKVHCWQYLVARRQPEAALAFMDFNTGEAWVEFGHGHYAQVERMADLPLRAASAMMLGDLDQPELRAQLAQQADDGAIHRIALELGRGDTAAAHAELEALWTRLPAERASGATYVGLEALGEILLTAGMSDETRRLVAYLAAQSKVHPVRGYERVSNLAAALLDDPTLVIDHPHTERDARLGDAARADLAGDHARAAAILGELIANPSFTGDLPERAQRLRDLDALHRTDDAAALCRDSLQPTLFRPAFLALRRACGG